MLIPVDGRLSTHSGNSGYQKAFMRGQDSRHARRGAGVDVNTRLTKCLRRVHIGR
jgi:hypothetical protein